MSSLLFQVAGYPAVELSSPEFQQGRRSAGFHHAGLRFEVLTQPLRKDQLPWIVRPRKLDVSLRGGSSEDLYLGAFLPSGLESWRPDVSVNRIPAAFMAELQSARLQAAEDLRGEADVHLEVELHADVFIDGKVDDRPASVRHSFQLPAQRWIEFIKGLGVLEIQRDTQRRHADLREAERLRTEAGELLDRLKDAQSKAGSRIYYDTFESLARTYERSGGKWLLATIGAGILVVLLGAALLFTHTLFPDKLGPAFYTSVAGRAVVLSIAVFLLSWCAKNYRANRHNETINRHRAAALRTFEQFVDGTRDEATKNAVLLRTTEAIFQHQQTGYQAGDSDLPPQSAIVDILRKESSK